MSQTYRQLQESIDKMTDEQKDCKVRVYDDALNKYFPVSHIEFNDICPKCNALHHNYPILVIKMMNQKD